MIKDPQGYIPLIEYFLEKKIPAKEFSNQFWNKIGNDRYMYSKLGEENFSDLIDELCYFVDLYVDDETLAGGGDQEPFEREGDDLDEAQLRQEVIRIFKEIRNLE